MDINTKKPGRIAAVVGLVMGVFAVIWFFGNFARRTREER